MNSFLVLSGVPGSLTLTDINSSVLVAPSSPSMSHVTTSSSVYIKGRRDLWVWEEKG